MNFPCCGWLPCTHEQFLLTERPPHRDSLDKYYINQWLSHMAWGSCWFQMMSLSLTTLWMMPCSVWRLWVLSWKILLPTLECSWLPWYHLPSRHSGIQTLRSLDAYFTCGSEPHPPWISTHDQWEEFLLHAGSLGNQCTQLRRTRGKGKNQRSMHSSSSSSAPTPSLNIPALVWSVTLAAWFKIHSYKHSGQPAVCGRM